jgi:uncharacterized protein (DUF1697 family)
MPKYVAFLRAINLGGHTFKMDELRCLFEGMGFAHVETFIASGNVIFEAASTDSGELQQKIEAGLQRALGYGVATFLRTTVELSDIARYAPFDDPGLASGSSTLYIAFLASPPGGKAVEKLLALASPVNQFHAAGREVYWLCRSRFSDSGISGAQIEKALGMPATIRNSSTVKKIAEKYA